MDRLLAALTNLGYEFYGILLPGFGAVLTALLLWVGVGSTGSPLGIPNVSPKEIGGWLDRLSSSSSTLLVVSMIALSYFLGHSLKWATRAGSTERPQSNTSTKWWVHARQWLKASSSLRAPKSDQSFHAELTPVLTAMCEEYGIKVEEKLRWRIFYPIAKSHVMQLGKPSLLATYQNKYTLHRSLAALAKITILLTGIVLLGGGVAWAVGGLHPRWGVLFVLLIGAILARRGFTSSYQYNWLLWGDSVITESYALKFSDRKSGDS